MTAMLSIVKFRGCRMWPAPPHVTRGKKYLAFALIGLLVYNSVMYEFSWMWFFVGILTIVAGVLFLRFYKQIADNMGSGVASYQRYKLVALGICGAGFIMMFNLHTMVIAFIANLIFGGVLNK